MAFQNTELSVSYYLNQTFPKPRDTHLHAILHVCVYMNMRNPINLLLPAEEKY